MTLRILLVNSDLAANRGDRAIAEGNIELVRRTFPEARVLGISQHPERDRRWYGADFLDMDFQSLDPRDLVRLLRAARRADVVLWGGGEFLKDYTNKTSLWYWVLKMTAVSLVNRELYGVFQGIGPTSSRLSRRLIAFVVGRCRAFVVRDEESRDKLVAWGARPGSVHPASDPAVLPRAAEIDDRLAARLRDRSAIDEAFLDDAVCIAPRDWFHYRHAGLLPHKYARRLPWARRRPADPRHEAYLAALDDLVSAVTRDLGRSVLLLPMHMTENDAELCHRIAAHATDPARVRVLDDDDYSPAELRAIIARTRAMIGLRLHSTIVGISGGVPCLNLYYVDKGRVFFDQIGQSRFAIPIERTLEPGFVPQALELVGELLRDRERIRAEITDATDALRAGVVAAFEATVGAAVSRDAG